MREILGQVLDNLLRNKLRSALTMAGIAWGVASIVLIVAMGEGFKSGQRNNTKSLGEDLVIVFGGRTEKQAGGERAGKRVRPTMQDVRAVRSEAFLVRRVAAELSTQASAVSPYNSGSFETTGVEPDWFGIRTIPLASGRHFTAADENDGARVCILGNKVKKQLFGTRAVAPGVEIRINSLPFRVVGFMEDKQQNSSYSGRDADKVLIPYSTLERDMPPKWPFYVPGLLNNFVYQPRSIAAWEDAQRQVRKLMGRNHAFDPTDEAAVRMWDTLKSAEMVAGIFDSMTAFLGIIALVTLTLGGVGVMNIMLVSVTERTREIGIRKAMGATRRRILVDFLFEGVILAFASGAAGWSFAWGLSWIVNQLPKSEMLDGLPVDMTTASIAFSALVVIAIASSILPAWRAASLQPVEALRFER